MGAMRPTYTLLLAAACVPLVVAASYLRGSYAELPVHVPVHWDLENEPNGWMTKAGFVAYFAGFVGLMNAMLLAAHVVPPRLLRFPHKAAWLSRAEGRTELQGRLRVLLVGGLVVINWLALGGLHLTITEALPGLGSVMRYSPLQFTAIALLVSLGFLVWTYGYMKPPALPIGGNSATT